MPDTKPTALTAPQEVDAELLERLAVEFVDRWRRGELPSLAEYSERYPELAQQIHEFFPTIATLEEAKQHKERAKDGRVSLRGVQLERLGDFRVIREIGRGGMGIVFEAEQESLGRRVAVKVLPRSLLYDERQVERFRREAQTAAGLHHTNIVPVFGVGEHDGFHFYVMQLIDGVPLDHVKLTMLEVARCGWQVATALQYAHERGVMHRDIKPSNLLIDGAGSVWIADFGLAKAIEADSASRTGDVIGTLRYMAPEQFRGLADESSDVYSLGVTMYELLAGVPAFDDAARRAAMSGNERLPQPIPLRRRSPTVPRDLETILHKAFAEEPRLRYATAGDFADDLQRFLDDRPIHARRSTAIEQAWRWSRRNPIVASLSAATGLLLVAIATVASAAYFRLESAWQAASISQARSERSARLAATALDQIFGRFAAPNSASAGDDAWTDSTSQPAQSRETAALLQELLSYYDRLAAEQSSDSRFLARAAEARRNVGDIQQQLGQFDAAIQSYHQALALRRRLATFAAAVGSEQLTLARLHNGIGRAHLLLGNRADSRAAHEESLRVLATAPNAQSPTMQFEAARTHFLMGRFVRPGMGPFALPPDHVGQPFAGRRPPMQHPGGPDRPVPFGPPFQNRPEPRNLERPEANEADGSLSHIRIAAKILERLSQDAPREPRFRLLLAACYREQASDRLSARTPAENQLDKSAIEVLDVLVTENPDAPLYRYELVQTLAEFSIFGEALVPAMIQPATDRLKNAIEHGEQLVAAHPNVPDYATALTHSEFKLGVVTARHARDAPEESRDAVFAEAERLFRKAINRQATLVKRYSDAYGYAVWLGVFQRHLGEALRDRNQLTEAQSLLTRSIRNLTQVQTSHPEQPAVGHQLASSYFSLASVHHRQGNRVAADKARREADRWSGPLSPMH